MPWNCVFCREKMAGWGVNCLTRPHNPGKTVKIYIEVLVVRKRIEVYRIKNQIEKNQTKIRRDMQKLTIKETTLDSAESQLDALEQELYQAILNIIKHF